jgi:nicotinamide-nucleotide amidase
MKVLIISVGTELLQQDILDTNAAQVTRRLHENGFELVARTTVGDELPHIVDTLRLALDRVDAVLTIGGLGNDENDLTRRAVAEATGHPLLNGSTPPFAGAIALGGSEVHRQGFLLRPLPTTLICLPGQPQEMAYLLETEVIPILQRLSRADLRFGTGLVRTAGAMESTLQEQLADVPLDGSTRISYSSFAGQTDIVLWAEGETQEQVDASLAALRALVAGRLGDQVYGREGDRLESVLLAQLKGSGLTLAAAECHTGGALRQALAIVAPDHTAIWFAPDGGPSGLADFLGIDLVTDESDLTRWCRRAAERLREKSGRDAALLVFNHFTPGGVQVLVTLATSQGISIMQRSFGGHPININQWASTLAMTHVRRWLLAHSPLLLDEQTQTP